MKQASNQMVRERVWIDISNFSGCHSDFHAGHGHSPTVCEFALIKRRMDKKKWTASVQCDRESPQQFLLRHSYGTSATSQWTFPPVRNVWRHLEGMQFIFRAKVHRHCQVGSYAGQWKQTLSQLKLLKLRLRAVRQVQKAVAKWWRNIKCGKWIYRNVREPCKLNTNWSW
jgi:hypothetical protein